MIKAAWDEYRGWANRARTLQTASGRWSVAALVCTVLAAILGTLAGQADALPQAGRILSFLAAVTAAITPVLGRSILDVKREAAWIRARATAEAIKSECFRYVARLGAYAGESRDREFAARLDALAEPATREGLTALADPVGNSDARCPTEPLTVGWYVENRLREQKNRFYANGQKRNEAAVARLRFLALFTAIIAAVLGAAGSSFGISGLAPWIAVTSTLGAAIISYGLMDRRQYLAATYGAMVNRLSRIEALAAQQDLASLVATTEDLLQGEHSAWTDRMWKSFAGPPALANQATP